MSFRRVLIASLSMGKNSCQAESVNNGLLDELACPPPLSSRKQVEHRVLGAVTRRRVLGGVNRRDRPIHEHCSANYVAPGHSAPIPAVFAVIAIVTHAEVLIGVIVAIVIGIVHVSKFRVLDVVWYRVALFRHPKWLADAKESLGARIVIALVVNRIPRTGSGTLVCILLESIGGIRCLIRGPDPVLGQFLAIYVYAMSFRVVFNHVPRQSYYPLDIIGFGPARIFENDDIASLNIAVGQNGKVDAVFGPKQKLVDQQVIANVDGVRHRPGWYFHGLYNECHPEEGHHESDHRRFKVLSGDTLSEWRCH